jgi:hypothetical protein
MKTLWLALISLFILSCSDEKEASDSSDSKSPKQTEQLIVKDTSVEIGEDGECELNFALLSTKTNDKQLDSLIYVTSSFYAITDSDIDEIRAEHEDMQGGLTNLIYTVNYNKNGVFDISYDIEYLGAHLSYDYRNVSLDLYDKKSINLASLIKENKMETFLNVCNAKLNENIREAIKEVPEEDLEEIEEFFTGHEVTEETLGEFSINEKGIVVYYDTFFPHFARAYEPNSMLKFTFEEMTEFFNEELPVVKRLLNKEAVS